MFPFALCYFSVLPTLTLFPSAVRDVVSGETLVVSCVASADQPPEILWFRGAQQLNGSEMGRINVLQTIDDVSTNSRLTVTGFTTEEAGVYSCVAVNALGNDSRSFQVNTVGESVKHRFHLICSASLK